MGKPIIPLVYSIRLGYLNLKLAMVLLLSPLVAGKLYLLKMKKSL
jgi:hypothetical protein